MRLPVLYFFAEKNNRCTTGQVVFTFLPGTARNLICKTTIVDSWVFFLGEIECRLTFSIRSSRTYS